jgi:surfeit locus 1 family protein
MLKDSIHGSYPHKRRAPPVPSGGNRASIVRKRLLPAFAALIVIGIFCALGLWQLQRAEEKRALQAEYDRRALQAPVALSAAVLPAETLQFFRVEAKGYYATDYQLLLDNRVHHGVAGYHVLTPLRIAGSETRVLVNRGWVPLGADRAQLPAIDPPRGEVTVSGVAVLPRAGFSLGTPDPLRRDAVTTWQQLDLARYAAETHLALQPVVILLDPQSPAGGFVRDWARLDTGIAVHQGYAFQWFALAVTVIVLLVYWSVRASRRQEKAR